jgi:hypothetical protein
MAARVRQPGENSKKSKARKEQPKQDR